MKSRPTNVKELVQAKKAAYQGLVDASKWGVGGVWFGGTQQLKPFVWFFEWPEDVRNELCTDQNLTGSITISDLELLGIFMHWLTLESVVGKAKLKHQSPAIWCDNLNAVAWTYKFRSNTSSIAADILRALAARMHECKAGLLAVDHISGVFNTMADVASRKHTTDLTKFLQSFSNTFKPPKGSYWSLFRPSNKITWNICSQLLLKTSSMGSWRRLAANGFVFFTLGKDGLERISQPFNQTSKACPNKNKSIFWQPTADMLDTAAFLDENSKFVHKRSRWRTEPSHRLSTWTDYQAPWLKRKANIQKRSVSFLKGTAGKTHHHNHN